MAAKQSKKSKFDRNRVKCARYKAEGRREKAKQSRINRQSALQDRPDSTVSVNCLKKREERDRNSTPAQRRAAREAGERQFGDNAKGHHLHQREHGLATALTPHEFQKLEKRRKLVEGQPHKVTDPAGQNVLTAT